MARRDVISNLTLGSGLKLMTRCAAAVGKSTEDSAFVTGELCSPMFLSVRGRTSPNIFHLEPLSMVGSRGCGPFRPRPGGQTTGSVQRYDAHMRCFYSYTA